ncbi:substrate-binding domain-containing protein [Raoultibacter massiliensis]|uniref:substrate-binding domain-containing protein n=1 Tax=Raoultibacter massiliensis TaxID=1852371 RepID=UPI003A9026BE
MEFKQKALAAEDVAHMLDVSKNTVYSLAKTGKLSSYKIGRKLRFTLEDVQAYIAGSKQGSAIFRTGSAASDSGSLATWVPPVSGIGKRIPRTAADAFLLGGADAMVDGLATCLAESGAYVLRSYQNSYQALVDLYFGYLDAAAVSLWDSSSETCNLPYIKRLLPGMPVKVFQMACYTQGLLVQRGNPLGLRSWADLIHSGAVLANRERGAAARVLLDERLRIMEADPKTIPGYEREVSSALVQGSLIARKDADVGVGTEKVYHQVRGLDYLPLQAEQLVLVVAKKPSTERIAKTVQRCLKSDAYKQGLASMVGYDFRLLGECIYET